jgi:hypothetical protein
MTGGENLSIQERGAFSFVVPHLAGDIRRTRCPTKNRGSCSAAAAERDRAPSGGGKDKSCHSDARPEIAHESTTVSLLFSN